MLGVVHKLHRQVFDFFFTTYPLMLTVSTLDKSTFLDFLPTSSCKRSLWIFSFWIRQAVIFHPVLVTTFYKNLFFRELLIFILTYIFLVFWLLNNAVLFCRMIPSILKLSHSKNSTKSTNPCVLGQTLMIFSVKCKFSVIFISQLSNRHNVDKIILPILLIGLNNLGM